MRHVFLNTRGSLRPFKAKQNRLSQNKQQNPLQSFFGGEIQILDSPEKVYKNTVFHMLRDLNKNLRGFVAVRWLGDLGHMLSILQH